MYEQIRGALQEEAAACGFRDLPNTLKTGAVFMGVGMAGIVAVEVYPYAVGTALTPQEQRAALLYCG